MPGNWDLAANPRLGRSKHPAKYVRKYVQKYLQPRSRLRRHLRLSLRLDLYLYLNLDLDSVLHRALLAKFYPQLLKSFLATIFGSMFAAKHLWLQVQMCLASRRHVLPPPGSLWAAHSMGELWSGHARLLPIDDRQVL